MDEFFGVLKFIDKSVFAKNTCEKILEETILAASTYRRLRYQNSFSSRFWKVGQMLYGELSFLGSFKNIVLKNNFQVFHFTSIFITLVYLIFSISRFSNVIQALADEKTTHIPFRNSVLTRLLQESLGGNCKTSLVVSDIIFCCFTVLLFFLVTEILGIVRRRRLKPTVLQLMNTVFKTGEHYVGLPYPFVISTSMYVICQIKLEIWLLQGMQLPASHFLSSSSYKFLGSLKYRLVYPTWHGYLIAKSIYTN